MNLDQESRDMIIRTLYGEAAGDPASQPGVAHVIKNRMGKTGASAKDVVLAKSQFEPWGSRSDELMGLDVNSPIYKGLGAVVDNVWGGQTPDPTGGATMFYAPQAQAALGRNAPIWDDGSGLDLGQHRFFAGNFPTPKGAENIVAALDPSLGPTPTRPVMGPESLNNSGSGGLAFTPSFSQSDFMINELYIQALVEAGVPPEQIQLFMAAQNG